MLSEEEINERVRINNEKTREYYRLKELKLRAFMAGFCPECGHDKIKARNNLLFGDTKYTCVACGCSEVFCDHY